MVEQHVINFLSDFNTHAVLVTGSISLPGSNVNGSSSHGVGGPSGSPGYSFSPGFSLSSVGFGHDRGGTLASNSLAHPTSSPSMLMNGGLALLTPQNSGPVAGMLGLGRTTTALTTYHSPSHHSHYSSPEAQESQRKLVDLVFQYRYVVDQLVYYSTIKTSENFFQLASLLFCTLLSNRIFQIWSPAYLKDPRKSTNPRLSSSSPIPGSSSGGGSIEGDESGDRTPAQASASGMLTQQQQQQRIPDGDQLRVWPEPLRKWVEALDYFVSFFPFHARQLETLKALHHSLILS